jgi:hypothetical protein
MKSYIFKTTMVLLALGFGLSFGTALVYENPETSFLKERVDASLVPQVKDFLASAKNYGVKMNLTEKYVQFGDPKAFTSSKNSIGACDYFHGTVILDPIDWTHLNEGQKQELMDHELGHCLLGRTHTDMVVRNIFGQPFQGSVMATRLFDNNQAFAEYKAYYEAELFYKQTFNRLSLQLLLVEQSHNTAEDR